MDIMLERILSLIPKKPNGDFVHGEKKKFAVGIGFKSGEIVSDWIANRSDSYKNYLYEISQKYDVSVEWLRGETDIKKTPTPEGEREEMKEKVYSALERADPAIREAALRLLGVQE